MVFGTNIHKQYINTEVKCSIDRSKNKVQILFLAIKLKEILKKCVPVLKNIARTSI